MSKQIGESTELNFKFQKEKGLLDIPYNLRDKVILMLEEIFELFPKIENPREFAIWLLKNNSLFDEMVDDDKYELDCFGDLSTIAEGAMFHKYKTLLKNEPNSDLLIKRMKEQAMVEIAKVNLRKTGSISDGKYIKTNDEKPNIPLNKIEYYKCIVNNNEVS